MSGNRKGLVLLGLLLIGVVGLAWGPTTSLDIASENQVLLQLPAAPGDRFRLTYTHSMYGGLVQDTFRLDAQRGLVLESVTANAAALEYSALWPTGYLADGTPFADGLDRDIGVLLFSVDDVGRPGLVFGDIQLDLRALFGGQGRVQLAFGHAPRLAMWWQGVRPSRVLVVDDAATGRRLWQGPILDGETFALSYRVEDYDAGVEDRYAVKRGGTLILRQAVYGSLALAGDCSIRCDVLAVQGDAGIATVDRELPDLYLDFFPSSHLSLTYRKQAIPLYALAATDGSLYLHIAPGP